MVVLFCKECNRFENLRVPLKLALLQNHQRTQWPPQMIVFRAHFVTLCKAFSICLKSVFCSCLLSLIGIMMFRRLFAPCSNLCGICNNLVLAYSLKGCCFQFLPSSIGSSFLLPISPNIITRLGSFLFLNLPCVI